MQTLKLLLLSFILSINCFAQQKDTLVTSNPLKMHKWAVQFEVGNDFRLTSFDGVIISLKYHFSPKFALRFGAGVNLSNSEQTLDYHEYNGYSDIEPYNDNAKEIILTTNFLFYPNPHALIKIFFGAGPRASYQHINDERIYTDGYKGHRKVDSWAVGLNGVFGCEWFPLNSLSLFGEYSVYATYGETTNKDYVIENSTGLAVEYFYLTSENLQFRGNIARLGASFYF